MTKEELSKLSDEELLKKNKKMKNAKIMNAFLIGSLFGIILWSIFKNSWGLVTLIPLFLIYKMVNNSKKNNDLKDVLKERNLN